MSEVKPTIAALRAWLKTCPLITDEQEATGAAFRIAGLEEESTAFSIILVNNLLFSVSRYIWYHYNRLSYFKSSCRIMDNTSACFMYKSHRKLFP